MTVRKLAALVPHRVVHAHCDIPCGIYDPHEAQLAAQTVERMVTLIQGLPDSTSEASRNSFVRMVDSSWSSGWPPSARAGAWSGWPVTTGQRAPTVRSSARSARIWWWAG